MLTVTRRGDRLIAVKATDPADEDRRRAEGELLARLDHSGVVELVDLVEGPPMELHLVFVGPDTWVRHPPTNGAAAALAAVATTVADLHDLGTAHGAIQPDHILVAADGRPVLCGLADAQPADAAGRAVDLDALAALVDEVAAGAPSEDADRLRGVARAVRVEGLDARTLAARLTDLVPHPARGRRRRVAGLPPRTIGAGLAALAATAVAVLWLSGPGTSEPSPSSTPAAPVEPSPAPTEPLSGPSDDPDTSFPSASTDTAVSAPTTAPSPSPPRDEPADTPSAARAPGRDGGAAVELVHDGRRYGVGEPGDLVVVGDWDCDGVATAALLRPATGLVAVFAGWPDAGGTLAPTATTTVPGADDLRVEDDDGCDRLRVVRPDGSILFREVAP